MISPFKSAVTFSSLAVIALCSYALANSNDTDTQAPGQAADSVTTTDTYSNTTKSDAAHIATNTCVDENGVILHKSDKAFSTCQSQKRHDQSAGQMPGRAGFDKDTNSALDTSNNNANVPPVAPVAPEHNTIPNSDSQSSS